MTIGDSDYHFMLNSLNIQLRLVRDRIEQMQLVEKAIQDTAQMIKEQHTIDWSQMLNLIHLTGMEKASRISIRMPPTFPPGSTSTACTPRTNRDGFPGSLSSAGSHPVFVFWSWAAGTERYGPTIFPSAGGYLHHTFRYFQRYAPRCQTSHRFLGYPVCIPGL